MRNFLLSMWGMTTTMIPREALQILPYYENGWKVVTKILLKCVFTWTLFFGPMLLLRIINEDWLSSILIMISMLFSLPSVFTPMDLYMFYGLPGIRLDEEGLLIKDEDAINYSYYPYRDIVHIHQITLTGNKYTRYYLELVFVDGIKWQTMKRPDCGVPFLIELTDILMEKCECPVSPVFDTENV